MIEFTPALALLLAAGLPICSEVVCHDFPVRICSTQDVVPLTLENLAGEDLYVSISLEGLRRRS